MADGDAFAELDSQGMLPGASTSVARAATAAIRTVVKTNAQVTLFRRRRAGRACAGVPFPEVGVVKAGVGIVFAAPKSAVAAAGTGRCGWEVTDLRVSVACILTGCRRGPEWRIHR